MMPDLFTVQQETALEEKISQVKEQAALDLVIVTALSTGNKDAQLTQMIFLTTADLAWEMITAAYCS